MNHLTEQQLQEIAELYFSGTASTIDIMDVFECNILDLMEYLDKIRYSMLPIELARKYGNNKQ